MSGLRSRGAGSAALVAVVALVARFSAVEPGQSGSSLSEVWAVALDSVLNTPQGIVVTKSCQIWILDRRTAIHRSDCERRTFIAVGKSGAGPGEYSGPWTVGLHLEDTVLIWDKNLRRITLFQANGQLARTLPLNVDPNREGQVAGMSLALGYLLAWTNNYPAGAPRPNEQRSFVWRVDISSGARDSILSMDGPRSIIIRDARSSSRIDAPFAPRPWILFLDNGHFLMLSSGSDTARELTERGTFVRQFSMRMPENALDSRDRRQYVESARKKYFDELAQQHYGPDLRDFFTHRWDELRAKMVFPAFLPRFDLPLISDDSVLWVLRSAHRNDHQRIWNRYSLIGRPVGATFVRHRGSVLAAAVREGVLYALETDTTGESFWLVAYGRGIK